MTQSKHLVTQAAPYRLVAQSTSLKISNKIITNLLLILHKVKNNVVDHLYTCKEN